MRKCFLAYSHSYRHVMTRIKGILESIGFDVDVVDKPDDQRPPREIVRERIINSDCVVVLFGPQHRPNSVNQNSVAAKWPYDEASFANGRKPLTLIIHEGTDNLPEFLKDEQTSPRLNFWDDTSFSDNIHHIVKHLLDFKFRLEGESRNLEIRYKRVECHSRIQREGLLYADWYHEAEAVQMVDHFHHTLKPITADHIMAVRRCFEQGSYELEVTLDGPRYHKIFLEPFAFSEQEVEYLVKVEPPLKPGEVIGYRRRFILPNWFPLTQAEIKAALDSRSLDSRFPRPLFEERFFGGSVSFPIETDEVVYALHFPRSLVKIKEYRAVVVDRLSQNKNLNETKRCENHILLDENPASPELVLMLKLNRPLTGYRYYLQYQVSE